MDTVIEKCLRTDAVLTITLNSHSNKTLVVIWCECNKLQRTRGEHECKNNSSNPPVTSVGGYLILHRLHKAHCSADVTNRKCWVSPSEAHAQRMSVTWQRAEDAVHLITLPEYRPLTSRTVVAYANLSTLCAVIGWRLVHFKFLFISHSHPCQ